MIRYRRVGDVGAMKVGDALHAQTYAQYRRGDLRDGLSGHMEVFFIDHIARAGRDDDAVERAKRLQVVPRILIITDDKGFDPERLGGVVGQIPGKGVIVVNDEALHDEWIPLRGRSRVSEKRRFGEFYLKR